jgi:hypothetical protein
MTLERIALADARRHPIPLVPKRIDGTAWDGRDTCRTAQVLKPGLSARLRA